MKRRQPILNGILLVDKPAGWTSHDVVAKCRRLLGERRIGHTGTLDPAATGLLVLCVGQATRLVEEMTAHGKRYCGEITLGAVTDTDDATGRVIEVQPVPDVSDAMLRQLEAQFSGELEQVPPAFSAIQLGGQRAYAAARAGQPLTLPTRRVAVDELRLSRTVSGTLTAEVRCGPGTYIRSLARDIGVAIGCGGHLSALRRERVGELEVCMAWSIDELEQLSGIGAAGEALLPLDEGLSTMDAAILSAVHAEDWQHGRSVAAPAATEAVARVRVYGEDGVLIGLGRTHGDGQLRPSKVLAPAIDRRGSEPIMG